jgi:hypothetical protein
MKHILNNLTEEEKNSIREQHAGGMKVMTENFSKLLNSKLGDAKPLVNEQSGDRLKEQLGNLKKELKSDLGLDAWKDTDNLLSIYKKLLPFKGKQVSNIVNKNFSGCDFERTPQPSLHYFNKIWNRQGEYCMGSGTLFTDSISKIGDNDFGGKIEKSKDGKYTTPQVKKMIIDLVNKG